MLRRHPSAAGDSPAPDTLPIIQAARDRGIPPATPEASRGPDGAARRWRERIRAAMLHLAISVALAGGVLSLVLLVWYPMPMHVLLGVGAILAIMLGVDVVLGPLFTLLVYDRRKRRLKWDLATIAALQLAALLYGVHTVYQGRPAFVVLVKDRFEVVSTPDILPEARAAARGNPVAQASATGPRWVTARIPESAEDRF